MQRFIYICVCVFCSLIYVSDGVNVNTFVHIARWLRVSPSRFRGQTYTEIYTDLTNSAWKFEFYELAQFSKFC
jgi:hypothetical protein